MTKYEAIEILNATLTGGKLVEHPKTMQLVEALAAAGAFTNGATKECPGPCDLDGRMWNDDGSFFPCRLCNGTGRVPVEPARPVANGASEPDEVPRRMYERFFMRSTGLAWLDLSVTERTRFGRIVDFVRESSCAVTFEHAWAEKEREGYQYGEDALEQVRFGWEIAMAAGARTCVGIEPDNRPSEDARCPVHGRPVATGSKARAGEIVQRELEETRGLHGAFELGARFALKALDRAKFFADEATLAEIDRLASLIERTDDRHTETLANVAFELATEVRKLGIGGGK